MSSFGTKKPGANLTQQMTFPSVFSEVYSVYGAKPRFAPEAPFGTLNISHGDDFQANWHAQKKADAHRMSRAKVHSTVMMNSRAETAVHNMPSQPKPVLGQRKYANPSMGAMGGGVAREDYDTAPFHFSDSISGFGAVPSANGSLVGGVLRSTQGQIHGHRLLQNRIQQLNAINAAKETFDSQGNLPYTETGEFNGGPSTAGLALIPQVELAQILQSVLDSLQSGIPSGETEDINAPDVTRFTYQDSIKAFSLIIRLATTGTSSEIADALEFITGTSAGDGIIPKLNELTITPQQYSTNPKAGVYLSLKEFWARIKIYLEKMMKLTEQPEQNRRNASKALIKSLNFTKFRGQIPREFIEADDAQQAIDDVSSARFSGGWEDGSSSGRSSGPGGQSTVSSGDAPSFLYAPERTQYPRGQFAPSGTSSESSEQREQRFADRGSQLTGHRSRDSRGTRLIRREDSQHGYRDAGAAFDDDERNTFAYASGEWANGGRAVGWADDGGAVEYGDAPVLAGEDDGEDAAIAEGDEVPAVPAVPRAAAGGLPIASRRNEFGDWDAASSAPRTLAEMRAASAAAPAAARAVPAAARAVPAAARAAPGGAAASPAKARFPMSVAALPTTPEGYRELAARVNAYYEGALPDGKGPIRVYQGSKITSMRANFKSRLGL